MNLELKEIEAVKRLMCVKTAVAGVVLATVAGAWAQQLVSSATPINWPYNDANFTALGVATTVPAAYVVAAVANSGNDEVIAWQNTTSALVQVGTPQVVDDPGAGIAITGLDASRVVTADISSTGNVVITTWKVGPDGVVEQKQGGTGPNAAYHNVAITRLSSTQVVTAYQQGDKTLAVEAWTVAADGTPTQEGKIATGGPADQLSIATVNENQVVTAINDTLDGSNALQVETWGVDSAGVQSQTPLETMDPISAVPEGVAVAAGSAIKIGKTFPRLPQIVQAAFTPIITQDDVGVVNWEISESGGLTQTNATIPMKTTTPTDEVIAGCMLPENVPITAYGNDDGNVYVGSAPPWNVVSGGVGTGFNSIAMTNAGTGNHSYFSPFYDAYFVTAVLAYEGDLVSDAAGPTAVLEIREYSYQVRGPFAVE